MWMSEEIGQGGEVEIIVGVQAFLDVVRLRRGDPPLDPELEEQVNPVSNQIMDYGDKTKREIKHPKEQPKSAIYENGAMPDRHWFESEYYDGEWDEWLPLI